MKNLFFSLKAVKAAAVFAVLTVLLFAGCSNPSDGPDGPNNPSGGRLTITNLPGGGDYEVYVFASGTDISTFAAIENNVDSDSRQAVGTSSSGNVFTLYGWDGSSRGWSGAWTGSGSRPVLLFNNSGDIYSSENPIYSYATVTFTNGIGTASFSSFTAVVYSVGPGPNPGTGGTLTIANLPEGVDYAVGVYNHSGEISDLLEWALVASDIVAVGAGTASSSMTLYAANTASAFTGTGSYMVALYTTSVPITVLYQTGVNFTDGSAVIDYDNMTDLLDNAVVVPGDGNGRGTLTIAHFPAGTSLIITVFDYDGEITNLMDFAAIQADLTKRLAIPSGGMASSSPVSLRKVTSPLSSFDGTGTYLVLLSHVETFTTWYADQVSFTDGCAELDFSTLGLMSDLPLTGGGTGGGTGKPISDINGIGAYLASQSGGSTADNAINLVINIALSEDNWKAILNAIETSGKYVNLDLSACTGSGNGGGLRSDGTFDPISNFSNGKDKIVEIVLPNTTISIISNNDSYGSSFQYFNALTDVTIPDSVTSIGQQVFYRCRNLTSLTIGNGVTSIGDFAFGDCDNLASVTIGNRVTSIGNNAFSYCDNLTSVTFQGTILNSNFNDWYGGTFPGDLRDKFYATDSENGTPGVYTRASGGETWTRIGNACTVTFDSNGGSAVSPVIVGDGSKISAPAVPTKDGYTFGGWYKESGLINQWDFNNDTVTENITLYAKFNLNKYTVTFNTDGGASVSTQTIEHGALVTRPATNPSKTGYTFDSWYKNSGFTTLWNFNIDTVTANTTIYAKFDINKYTVTFNSNDGSVVEPQTINHGSTVTRPPNPTKAGYGLINWYSNEGLTTIYNFSTQVTGNITLYAKWGPLVTSAEDISDFGSGAVIADIFTVSDLTEWNNAKSVINGGENNRNYIINITASFSIPGSTSYTFTPRGLNISIRGAYTLSLSSNGNLLRIYGQRVIIRDLTLKGLKNGVDGASSDNDASLVYFAGDNDNDTIELKGTASITGNVNSITSSYTVQHWGGGVYLSGGTFIMWDNSSITGNSVITNSGGTDSWAFGGGICVNGTLIMRGNSSITNNTVNATAIPGSAYNTVVFGFGGGVFIFGSENFRIEGGIISGNNASHKGSSLYVYVSGVDFGLNDNARAQYGTFSENGSWTSKGNLSTSNNTIHVVNGELQ